MTQWSPSMLGVAVLRSTVEFLSKLPGGLEGIQGVAHHLTPDSGAVLHRGSPSRRSHRGPANDGRSAHIRAATHGAAESPAAGSDLSD